MTARTQTRSTQARRARTRRKQEGGFALLLVFLMAAAVAFTIYQQIPRVAFESVRNKEQMLMDRGNQYKRAIEVFYAVNKRYPARLEDLENTNNKRYLRRRYKDPMTGSDEWRLVHTNGSFLTDSLVQKPPAQNASNGQPANGQLPGGGPLGTNTMNTADATDTTGQGTTVATAVNPAVLRRPSDRILPQDNPGAQQGFNPQPNSSPFDPRPAFDPNDPRTFPPITLQPQAQQPGQALQPGQNPFQQQLTQGQFGPGTLLPGQGVQGQPVQGQQSNGQFVLPGFGGSTNVQTGIQPVFPTSIPGQLPGQGVAGSIPGGQLTIGPDGQLIPTNPFAAQQQQQQQQQAQQQQAMQQAFQPFQAVQPSQPVQPARPFGGAVPQPQLPNQAVQTINDQLFRPNQNQITPGNATQGSPGIAGVASTFKGPSIKAYRERLKYEEWEFVFQPAAVQPVQGQQPQNQGQPNQGQPQNQTQPGQQPSQQPNQQPIQQPGLPGLMNPPEIMRP